MFRYLVLGLLRDGNARHGYALMKEYRRRSGLQVSTGNFYRELQRLVVDGLVRTVRNPADADPRRAPYAITEEGVAAFDAWLSGPAGSGFGRYEDELSARALFVVESEPAAVRVLLDTWKEELWLRSKVQERTRETALARLAAEQSGSLSVLPLLLARALKHIATDIEFLDQLDEAYHKSLAAGSEVRRPVRRGNVPRSPRPRLRGERGGQS
jgi:DNA-binding PadR family transcriptional regulator